MDGFHEPVLAAGALSPLPGEYAVVFDSAARAGAGAFTFRYWVDDVKPPVLRLRTPSVVAGKPVLVSATDAGCRRLLRVDPDRRSTARPGAERSAAASSRSRRAACRPGRIACACACPTTRSRRTPRTSRASSRTRAQRPSRSASASQDRNWEPAVETTRREADGFRDLRDRGSARADSRSAGKLTSFCRAPRSSGARRGRAGRSG